MKEVLQWHTLYDVLLKEIGQHTPPVGLATLSEQGYNKPTNVIGRGSWSYFTFAPFGYSIVSLCGLQGSRPVGLPDGTLRTIRKIHRILVFVADS